MKPQFRTYILLFFSLVGISLFTLNSKNLTDFNLQHMSVEAIVERRTVKLGGSYSHYLQPNGDVLTYQGNVYPIKQPGTSMLGALAYFPLSKLGHLYSADYLFASAWVSLWTSSVILGLLGLVIYALCLRAGVSGIHSVLISLGSLLCTTVFPYTGFPHHDLLVVLPIYLALYLVIQGLATAKKNLHHDYFYLAGFLSSLSLFFSILPATLIVTLTLLIFFKKGLSRTLEFVLGGIVGLFPSLTYNYFVLGGFFHFPNLMGSSVDTIPHFNIMSMIPALLRYFTSPGLSVILFSPLAFMGLVGWIVSKNTEKKWLLLRTFVLLSTILFALHLSSFETEGDLQYGPRYLLPLLPLWFIGIRDFLSRKSLRYPLVILVIFSFLLNLLGALYGAMYKEITIFPLFSYLGQLTSPTSLIYPFRIYGIIISLLVGFIVLINSVKKS